MLLITRLSSRPGEGGGPPKRERRRSDFTRRHTRPCHLSKVLADLLRKTLPASSSVTARFLVGGVEVVSTYTPERPLPEALGMARYLATVRGGWLTLRSLVAVQ